MDTRGVQPLMVESIVTQLANGIVAGPDDLPGMGECINLIEQLENCGIPLPRSWVENLRQLKQLFGGIILESSSDIEADWQRVQQLLTQIGSLADGSRGDIAQPLTAERLMAVDEPVPANHAEDDLDQGCGEVVDSELLKDFVLEAGEHLSTIELNMLTLEANPSDLDAINEVFRPFHSIKGVAGFLNMREIQELAHEVETLLDEARSGKLYITASVIDLVLNAVDILKSLLQELEEAQDGRNFRQHSPLVKEFLERIKNFRPDEADEGLAGPASGLSEILVERSVIGPGARESLLEQGRRKGNGFEGERIEHGLADAGEAVKEARDQQRLMESASVIRIDTRKLDNLVDIVGELVIAQSMILHNPEVENIRDQKLQKDSVQLQRITTELQRISMSMRMVPIKSTFQRMIRLVRDLSKKSGKEVTLEMKGEDTEIDRNMVEEIYEPLVHMIRNAVDHGIEMPEGRQQSGKSANGTIVLSAEHKSGNIVIEIRDDGQGLDAPRIRAKAIERGLLLPGENVEEAALFELIFHPGFSTKENVTEVSGRGVGMDVVKRGIERLRGKVDIHNFPGEGAAFQFKLPLTMAIIDGMLIRVGGERYVVPTIAMEESLRPAKEAYLTVQGAGELIKVRNQLMPLIRLYEILDVEPRCKNPWDGLVLVVRENSTCYCLLADEIVGRREVVIKNLGGFMGNLTGISGGAILGDGRVALILDVRGVINLYEGRKRDPGGTFGGG